MLVPRSSQRCIRYSLQWCLSFSSSSEGEQKEKKKLSRRDKRKLEARITLRDFRLEDANYMKNWNRGKNEDNMMTRYGWPVIYSKADAMRSLKQMFRSKAWFQAICLSNIPIGDISLSRELDWILPDLKKDDSDGEMGYYIAPHSRGRGYGSVAVKKFVDVCFNRFKGLKSITVCVFLDNIPSQRLAVACGFQRLLKDGGQRPLIGMYKDGNYKLRKIFFYRVYRPDLLESKHEAASAYGDASNSFKKISPKDAISCLDQAVNEFMEIGRFNMAARYCKEIGELYEVEQTFDQAIVYFKRSADLFQSEEVTTSANQCKLKVAQFSAQLEQYPRAIEIYEEIARQSLKNNLLKYSVKGYLLNAGLCQLCKGDVIAITNALERYQELDPSFNGTREHKFLADLAAALDEEDFAKFTDVVKDFDSMTMLDAWKTTLLLRVKEKLKAKELEEDDLT